MPSRRRTATRAPAALRFLTAQPPAGSDSWYQPWAQLRTFNYSPTIYPAMVLTGVLGLCCFIFFRRVRGVEVVSA